MLWVRLHCVTLIRPFARTFRLKYDYHIKPDMISVCVVKELMEMIGVLMAVWGLILAEMQRLKACVIDSDSPLLHLIADHESDYFLKLLSLALRDLWQHSSHWIHIGLRWDVCICGCLWFSYPDRWLIWFVTWWIIFWYSS